MWVFVGAICLMLGTFGISRTLDLRERRRVAEYGGVLDFLRYIRVQIDCFRMERRALFQRYENPDLEKTGFLKNLRMGQTMGEALAHSETLLEKEGIDLLVSFDRELGSSYMGEQLASCDYYIERWGQMECKFREGLPRAIQLKRTVTLSLGAMLLLLLL